MGIYLLIEFRARRPCEGREQIDDGNRLCHSGGLEGSGPVPERCCPCATVPCSVTPILNSCLPENNLLRVGRRSGSIGRNSLIVQAIHFRRLEERMAMAGKDTVALVVSEDVDDVRSCLGSQSIGSRNSGSAGENRPRK